MRTHDQTSDSRRRPAALRRVVAGGTLAALLAVLGLAACGGHDRARLTHAQYEHELRSAYGSVRQAFLGTRVGSLAQLDPKLEAAQSELRRAAEELESREPPRDVEEEHHELVEGLRAYADELDGLRTAAREGDARRVAAFNARIGQDESVERIAESLEEINHRGYDLGDVKLD